MLFLFPPLSLGWDSGYSHMRKKKQSFEKDVQYISKDQPLWHLIFFPRTRCVFTWRCGFECPVVHERRSSAPTESAPSMTIRVVERGPAVEAQWREL